jgi:polar amino acid transport system permease protein
VIEGYRAASIISQSTFNYTPLLAAALLYLAVTVPLARLVDRWGAGGRVR